MSLRSAPLTIPKSAPEDSLVHLSADQCLDRHRFHQAATALPYLGVAMPLVCYMPAVGDDNMHELAEPSRCNCPIGLHSYGVARNGLICCGTYTAGCHRGTDDGTCFTHVPDRNRGHDRGMTDSCSFQMAIRRSLIHQYSLEISLVFNPSSRLCQCYDSFTSPLLSTA